MKINSHVTTEIGQCVSSSIGPYDEDVLCDEYSIQAATTTSRLKIETAVRKMCGNVSKWRATRQWPSNNNRTCLTWSTVPPFRCRLFTRSSHTVAKLSQIPPNSN